MKTNDMPKKNWLRVGEVLFMLAGLPGTHTAKDSLRQSPAALRGRSAKNKQAAATALPQGIAYGCSSGVLRAMSRYWVRQASGG